MRRQRSALEVWVPAGYLVGVVGLVAWVGVLGRTGDAGFAGIWPILATAPLSLSALGMIMPDPESLGLAEEAPPAGAGPVPPEPAPVPMEAAPTGPAAQDLSGAELTDTASTFGFYGVILACALVNATALWAVVRLVTGRLARSRRSPGPA
ncbi:SCO4225 family membrane protein [Streptomyces polyrhachis]|uniref:SCO4225 family membrane protein n=1 Tax=Streptomyces polyrhachis TaxID=1282885 RepID=A0ABW2G8G9_9ACTN